MNAKIISIIFFGFLFLLGCGKSTDSVTATKATPSPVENPSDSSEKNDISQISNLTNSEISMIHNRIVVLTGIFPLRNYSIEQRRYMVGALIETATQEIHPLVWEKLADQDLQTLISYFFDSELNVK